MVAPHWHGEKDGSPRIDGLNPSLDRPGELVHRAVEHALCHVRTRANAWRLYIFVWIGLPIPSRDREEVSFGRFVERAVLRATSAFLPTLRSHESERWTVGPERQATSRLPHQKCRHSRHSHSSERLAGFVTCWIVGLEW